MDMVTLHMAAAKSSADEILSSHRRTSFYGCAYCTTCGAIERHVGSTLYFSRNIEIFLDVFACGLKRVKGRVFVL